MPDVRRVTFVALSSVLLFGTIYSVAYHTFLDTSNPLVALGHAPHHLAETAYFARKDNILNTIFIKKAWGWTTAAFVALLATAPRSSSVTAAHGRRGRSWSSEFMSVRERIGKWTAATAVWLLFAVWFFGPGVFQRVTSVSGGECVVRLPSGKVLPVPSDYCIVPTVVSPATHPDLFYVPPLVLEEEKMADWRTRPRLMRGHDVSGHVFLLTMSILFLADMIRPAMQYGWRNLPRNHRYALVGTGGLMMIWLFAIFTTAVYFHTPFEKLTGYLVGLAGFLVTQLPPLQTPIPEVLDVEGSHED